MGSLREDEDEESRPERNSARLEPAVSVSPALEVTPEASALTLRGGGSEPAAEAQRTCGQRLPPAGFSCRLSPAPRLLLPPLPSSSAYSEKVY